MATMSSPVPRTTGRTQQYGAAISRIRFRRAIALALMTMILPGSAQLAVGNKKVGWIAIRTVLGLALGLALVGLVAAVFNSLAFWLLTNTFVLGLIRFGLIGLA
ncbi:MAG TPA: hypothetical protein PKL71_10590, partial [Marmoricola sp.]|nr:hypothetical protein [Marmoricola sp.]